MNLYNGSQIGLKSKKPIILCLHGGGTSSTIFNIQTIRIQRPLFKFFDFVFVDAPYECPPGPDVLPTFEGCGPYFSWMRFYRAPLDLAAQKVIDNAIKGREEQVVAVMGFSQGARLGAGLLLAQQLRKKRTGEEGNFKFGIFCMGTCPPLLADGFSLEEQKEIVTIPSLHFVGKEDQWYKEGQKLFDSHFDPNSSTLTEFDIGHRLPILEEDNKQIVEGIKFLYEKTTGKKLVEYAS